MRTQKALVTGATGCLGRHLAAKLIAAGWHVRASGRDAAIGSTLQDAGAEFIAGDLLEAGLAQRLAEDVDVIFHCAALSSPWGRRAAFQAVNVDGTQALVDAAHLAGAARFVHVSSPSIYFTYQDAFDIPETAPLPRRFCQRLCVEQSRSRTGGHACRRTGTFQRHPQATRNLR